MKAYIGSTATIFGKYRACKDVEDMLLNNCLYLTDADTLRKAYDTHGKRLLSHTIDELATYIDNTSLEVWKNDPGLYILATDILFHKLLTKYDSEVKNNTER